MSLVLDEVTKEYPGGVRALDGVCLTIADGELVGVVGPSGSGKSTMLHVMGTLERPSSGRVAIAGADVDGLDDRQLAGLLFHEVYGRKGSPSGSVSSAVNADRLWVRETHTWIPLADSDPWRERATADGCLKRHPDGYDVAMIYRADGDEIGSNWRASIFMPRWASRITLDLVDVRIERLQDISEADAIAEGVERNYLTDEDSFPCSSAAAGFRTLWDSINPAHGWAINPWVWVVEFKPSPSDWL
jgi:energy-coupling factor transporter ATP-binding protein EcfA2